MRIKLLAPESFGAIAPELEKEDEVLRDSSRNFCWCVESVDAVSILAGASKSKISRPFVEVQSSAAPLPGLPFVELYREVCYEPYLG